MIGKRFFFVLALFFLSSFKAQKGNRVLLYEGNEAFQKKDYTTAIRKYTEAVEGNDKDFDAVFNLGNSLYKNKKYSEAEAIYTKALNIAPNKKDLAVTYYNLGNAHYQDGKLEAAEKAYREALKNNPNDEFARKNLQIIKSKRQNNTNNQNSKNNPKPQNNNTEEENKKGNTPKNNAQNPEDGGNNGAKKGKGTQDNGNQNNGNNQGNKPEIPHDVREKIFQNLSEKEKETARRILNKPTYTEPRSNEKDW